VLRLALVSLELSQSVDESLMHRQFHQLAMASMREMHHIVCTVFGCYKKEKCDKAHWLIPTLIQECAEHGWSEYRTNLALMDQAADTYCFNGNARIHLNETIKNALDSRGISAPGKKWRVAGELR
jgi:FAD linked oxidases, C-terminal domain